MKHMLNIKRIRDDFPLLSQLSYMDNAATSLSPDQVLGSMNDFERHYRANIGRGVHRLTNIATQRYWHCRNKVSDFIAGEHGSTVFTKSTTEAINMVAFGTEWKKGDKVIITVLEHHSNFLPWMRLRKRGVDVSVINTDISGSFCLDDIEAAIDDKTKMVALTHASNVLGSILPVKEIADMCHDKGSMLLVDGAQSVPHIPVNVKDLGCDFLCFSGHKMLGPTGTGVLWMREENIEPMLLGGGMVDKVTLDSHTFANGCQRYEAGTPNISGVIGLGMAVEYLEDIGIRNIELHERELTHRLLNGLYEIQGVTVYGPEKAHDRIGVVSFNVDGMHPHEVAHILDEGAAIMARSGEHCCLPLMERMGLKNGTIRISSYLYNTTEEVDLILETIKEMVRRL